MGTLEVPGTSHPIWRSARPLEQQVHFKLSRIIQTDPILTTVSLKLSTVILIVTSVSISPEANKDPALLPPPQPSRVYCAPPREDTSWNGYRIAMTRLWPLSNVT